MTTLNGASILMLVHHEPERDPRVPWSIRLSDRFGQVTVLAIGTRGEHPLLGSRVLQVPRNQRFDLRDSFRLAWSWLAVAKPRTRWILLPILSVAWLLSLPPVLITLSVRFVSRPVVGRWPHLDVLLDPRWLARLRYALSACSDLAQADRLLRTAGSACQPDLIHCHDLNCLLPAIRLAGGRIPVVYDAHEFWPWADTLAAPWEKRIWLAYERQLVAKTDCRLTVNPPLADAMAATYGVPFLAVMNCTPMEPTHVRKDTTGRLRCLFQGGFCPNRGIEGLIAAWAPLAQQAVLVLRGPPGPLRDACIAQARLAGGLGDWILFPDAVGEDDMIAAAARDGDIGLIPYLPVGLNNTLCCPNKLSQYMAAGLPILAHAGLPFVAAQVRDSGCGLTYDPERPATLHEAVRRLADPAFRGRCAANARQWFEAVFHWEVASEPLAREYARLLPKAMPVG